MSEHVNYSGAAAPASHAEETSGHLTAHDRTLAAHQRHLDAHDGRHETAGQLFDSIERFCTTQFQLNVVFLVAIVALAIAVAVIA